jgi:glycosyltransferase involved in cell wall biosynthesis
VAVGDYPVADELRALGFAWFDASDPESLRDWLASPADQRETLLAHNREVAVEELSTRRMAEGLESLLAEAGWLP